MTDLPRVQATQAYECPVHDVPTAECCHYCPTCDLLVRVCPHDYAPEQA